MAEGRVGSIAEARASRLREREGACRYSMLLVDHNRLLHIHVLI